MFNELDKVNWEKLTAAYGPATEVPLFIRGLCSDDSAARLEAFENLFEQLWHQENVYEASLYALPFLVELLEAPDVADKTYIAAMIGFIATGTPTFHSVKDDGADWVAILQKQGKSLEDELAKERILMKHLREEVKKTLPVLRPFLRDPDPDPTIRKLVSQVLVQYPEYREEHLSLLQDVLTTEPDEDTRHVIQQGIDQLGSSSEANASSQ